MRSLRAPAFGSGLRLRPSAPAFGRKRHALRARHYPATITRPRSPGHDHPKKIFPKSTTKRAPVGILNA